MTHRIVMKFPDMVAEDWQDKLGRVCNLGEDIHRELGKTDVGVISIQEVDRAADTLTVEVRKSQDLKSVLRKLEELSDFHFPKQSPTITVAKV